MTGWRLVRLDHVRHLYHHYGVMPALIWAGTLFMVVTTDLLTGVLTGLVLSLIELDATPARPEAGCAGRAA